MALNTKKPIEELKQILEAMNFFEKVSLGQPVEITKEESFPAVYINLDADINEENGKMTGLSGREYDRMLMVTLKFNVNTDGSGELYHLDVRDKVEETILRDQPLWQHIIDRTVEGSRWDKGASAPKREGEMGLVLFTRADILK